MKAKSFKPNPYCKRTVIKMKPVKKAKQLLRGNRLTTVAIQLLIIGARLLNVVAQLLLLRAVGLSAERVVPVSGLWSGEWLYGLVFLFALAADWLLFSPLLLGQTACYCRIVREEEAGFSLMFHFFGSKYTSALKWRLGLFLRRLLWSGICLLPAAVTAGYAVIVRSGATDSSLADITLMFCSLFGVFFLLAGLIASELIMMRYLPASFLLVMAEEKIPPKKLFGEARRAMRKHIGDMLWLTIRFTGWLAASAAVLPYFYGVPLFHTTRALTLMRYVSELKETEKKSGKSKVPAVTMTFDAPQQSLVKLPHGL